jgi:hypothetical protein
MGESIAEFMDRRRREIARFGRKAEAVAHEAYDKAIRAGQDLRLGSPGDVVRYGAKLLQAKEARTAAAVSNTIRETKRQAGDALNRLGQNPKVRPVAVAVAHGAGNVAGVARGGVHAVEGLADGAVFAGRLIDQFDVLKSPRGQSAVELLARGGLGAGRNAADYVRKAVADPRSVVRDVSDKAQRWRRALDPSATPAAPTFTRELRRNFDIGQNQGEVLFDAASLFVGGPAAKTIKGLGRVSNVGNVERYLAQGFSSRAATHLAEPYPSSGMGHHFIPRRAKLPESYSDSVFNVLKPDGVSRGDFYELHYKVDPKYHGGRVVRGEGWSGKKLGLEEYGLAGRLWHGSPPPLKARVGGLGAGAGAAMNSPGEQEADW